MSPNDAIVTVLEAPSSSSGIDEKPRKDSNSSAIHGRAGLPRPKAPEHTDSNRWTDKDSDDDQLSNIGITWARLRKNVLVRYTFYIVPVAVLLAIPIILFATVYKDARIHTTIKSTKLEPIYTSNITSINDADNSTNLQNNTSEQIFQQVTKDTSGGIRLLGLFIWIEVVWVLLWVAKLMAKFVPVLFQSVAGAIRTGIRKYYLVLRAVEVPLSLFFWAIFAIASRSIIWTFDQDFHKTNAGHILWLSVLHNVNKATCGVTALYLVQKLFIQMVSVNYHGKKQYDIIKELEAVSRAIETMFDVSRTRFYDFHPLFSDDDLDIHDTKGFRKDKYGHKTAIDDSAAIFMTSLSTTGDKITSVLGLMASDIAGKQVLMPTTSGPIVEAALGRPVSAEALARRIWNSFTDFGKTPLDEETIKQMFGRGCEAQASYIHRKVDTDENGGITLDEMIDLVKGVAAQRKTIWEGACNVKDAIKVLDRVLSCFVLIFIFLIYAAFFSDYLANHYTQVWSAFTGCSFLFASTAGELFAACITVFIKHPYDVGDRISINNEEWTWPRFHSCTAYSRNAKAGSLCKFPTQPSTVSGSRT
jgi:hypothetical protein